MDEDGLSAKDFRQTHFLTSLLQECTKHVVVLLANFFKNTFIVFLVMSFQILMVREQLIFN